MIRPRFNTRSIEFAYILLLPVIVWYLYGFSIFLNHDGYLDPWFYFGYIHNFEDLIARFGLRYYSVRFGLIFPHLVLNKMFGPTLSYLIYVYSMYLLAGIPFYLLFRKFFSVHAAIFAYAILVSSPWFATSVLWTHLDASAVAYLMAATALMYLEPKFWRLTNLAIGVLIAMAVNSNFFVLAISGLGVISYFISCKDKLWDKIWKDLPWIVAGFLLVTVMGSIGYYVCCGHYDYFTPTIDMVKWSMTGQGEGYMTDVKTLLTTNSLYLPLFLIVAMVIISIRKHVIHPRFYYAVTVYLLSVFLFYVLYEFSTSTAILELPYYFTYMLIPCIFCMALIPVILSKETRSESLSNYLSLGLVFLLPLSFIYSYPISFRVIPTAWLILCLVSTLLLLLISRYFKSVIIYTAVFSVLIIQLPLLSTPTYASMYFPSYYAFSTRLPLAIKFIEVMPKFKNGSRPIFFWYSNNDYLAHSLQSTYLWGFSRIFDSNPGTRGLPYLEGINKGLLNNRFDLVLFDRNDENVNKGIEMLESIGIKFKISSSHKICEEDICYMITILDINSG